MGKVAIFIGDGEGEGRRVETATEDDFFYFKDSLHYSLESGGFGSRFPLFQNRFPGGRWEVSELQSLEEELETIAEALQELPPNPQDTNWSSKLSSSGRQCESLYDVFIDSRGRPLVWGILELCRKARREGKPLLLE